jgi:RNA recognition motif-containing protein
MNIFIASLPFQLEESDIKELFEDYGEVTSVKLITDRETGRKRGFGFIEMPNEEEAMSAIKAMDQTEIYERTISVSQAEDRKQNNGNRGGSSGRGGNGGGYNKGGYNRGGGSGYNKRGYDRGEGEGNNS